MKTNVKKDGEFWVVTVTGCLNYEGQEPLKRDLDQIASKLKSAHSSSSAQDASPSKIIFNCHELEFVGSSGISNFIQTIRSFKDRAQVKPKFCNLRSEFEKVFRALDDTNNSFEFFEDEDSARFHIPQGKLHGSSMDQ